MTGRTRRGLAATARVIALAIALAGAGPWAADAAAQTALVHVQGDPGRREAYYADFAIVLDRTPADRMLGPTRVHQLDTVVVYEAADKPEFGALRLQFECVVKHAYDGKRVPPQPAFDAPVQVRVAEGSWQLRRADLQHDPLPAGPWRRADSPVLLKLHKVACHDDVLRSAMVQAAKAGNDTSVFGREAARIGLPADLQLVGAQGASDVLDFSWWVLWSGAPRPDPSGKWSRRPTRQELDEARARMAQIQRQVDGIAAQARPRLEQGVRQLEAESAFHQAAAEVRKGRTLSRNERLMLTAWEGRTDEEVAATMGAPVASSAGALHFLSYGREFDNRVVVGNRKGAVWEEGLYENCNVQFVLLARGDARPRVVDVRIWTQTNQGWGGVAFACTGLTQAPR